MSHIPTEPPDIAGDPDEPHLTPVDDDNLSTVLADLRSVGHVLIGVRYHAHGGATIVHRPPY